MIVEYLTMIASSYDKFRTQERLQANKREVEERTHQMKLQAIRKLSQSEAAERQHNEAVNDVTLVSLLLVQEGLRLDVKLSWWWEGCIYVSHLILHLSVWPLICLSVSVISPLWVWFFIVLFLMSVLTVWCLISQCNFSVLSLIFQCFVSDVCSDSLMSHLSVCLFWQWDLSIVNLMSSLLATCLIY